MQIELDELRHASEVRLDNFARMRDAGVMMAAGSDSAWGYYRMGDFQSEIEAHVIGGMSNMEAIVAATRGLRQVMLGRQIGRDPRTGQQADILVVEGNPLEDINQLRCVADVFLGGDRVDRANLI